MTASPELLQQRYEAIERVYSERRWDEVASLSEALLLEVPDEAGDPLRQRLQLLLGHTHLYGYKDAATASGFYSRVQAATSEAVLRDIAEQGLQQCASQLAAAQPEDAPAAESALAEAAAESSQREPQVSSTEAALTSAARAAAEAAPLNAEAPTGQEFPFSAEPVQTSAAALNTAAAPNTTAAMPWLERLGGVDPAAQALVATNPFIATGASAAPQSADTGSDSHGEGSAITVVGATAPAAAAEPPITDINVTDLNVSEVLLVDVVDEPEQIDVAQADPTRAEDVVLTVSAEPEPARTRYRFSPEEMAELSRGLLRVTIQ